LKFIDRIIQKTEAQVKASNKLMAEELNKYGIKKVSRNNSSSFLKFSTESQTNNRNPDGNMRKRINFIGWNAKVLKYSLDETIINCIMSSVNTLDFQITDF
jgi:hypothetical protein